MSNRTLVELNHDFCPGRSTESLAEWAAKMAEYMRGGDPKSLPYGVTFKHIRHHSDQDPLAEKTDAISRQRLPPRASTDQVVAKQRAR